MLPPRDRIVFRRDVIAKRVAAPHCVSYSALPCVHKGARKYNIATHREHLDTPTASFGRRTKEFLPAALSAPDALNEDYAERKNKLSRASAAMEPISQRTIRETFSRKIPSEIPPPLLPPPRRASRRKQIGGSVSPIEIFRPFRAVQFIANADARLTFARLRGS